MAKKIDENNVLPMEKVEYAVLTVGTRLGAMWVATIGSFKKGDRKTLEGLTLAEAQEDIKTARAENPGVRFVLAKRIIPWWRPVNEKTGLWDAEHPFDGE